MSEVLVGEKINIDDWMNKIEIKILEKGNVWENRYLELVEFVEKNGRLPTHKTNKSLNSWCYFQVDNIHKNILGETKISKLRNLNGWDVFENNIKKRSKKSWDESYNELSKFVEENEVFPTITKNKKLYIFYKIQCRKGRDNMLTKQQLNKLYKIKNFTLDRKIIRRTNISWEENYNRLVIYINNNNEMPTEKKNKSLHKWCKRQKEMECKLSDDKRSKLNNISLWKWSKKKENIVLKSWDDRFDELSNFIKVNKKMPSHHSKSIEERSIGYWRCDQKYLQKNNKLSQERINKLESLIGWYWSDK